jgi:RND family efflux transporter MFP subunit
MKFLKPKYLITPLILLVILSVGAVLAYQITGGESDHPKAETYPQESAYVSVVLQPLKIESSYAITREYLGQVEARRRSSLGFEQTGKLNAVQVDEGDQVTAGQIIATMDTDRLKARRAELVARRDQVLADLELAEITTKRREKLVGEEAIPEQDFDDARFQANALRSSLNQAEATIRSLDVDLEKAGLKAPFDGVIISRMADEGTVLSSGQPVLEVMETGQTEARIGIPARLGLRFSKGDNIKLEVAGETVTATVRAVLPTLQRATRTVDLLVTLTGSNQWFQKGELAVLKRMESNDVEGFWLPVSALTEGIRGLWSVYIGVPETVGSAVSDETVYRVERREIEIIAMRDERVYVRGMIKDGDQLIVGGLQKVVPGLLVQAPLNTEYNSN